MCTPGRPVYSTVTLNSVPLGIGVAGVITSLFAGHGWPWSAAPVPGGVQAGGSGLAPAPPTGLVSDAACASGSGSSGPFGSPG